MNPGSVQSGPLVIDPDAVICVGADFKHQDADESGGTTACVTVPSHCTTSHLQSDVAVNGQSNSYSVQGASVVVVVVGQTKLN